MKLLFAYFDCESNFDKSASYRGLGECGLNFSTTYEFVVEKEFVGNNNMPQYKLSCHKKNLKDQLPSNFWGDRIYNITALVGDNGVGKSSILHSLIKAVVDGLTPEVPFLLVLQKTESEDCIVYYGGGLYLSSTEFTNEDCILLGAQCTEQYPEELKKTKTMLLDNTLTVSSIDLDEYYVRRIPVFSEETKQNIGKKPIPEAYKQLFNKSLAASIRYSSEMSNADQPAYRYAVSDELSAYFRYESYHETRFIFDRYQASLFEKIIKEEFSVRWPRYIYVNVFSVDGLHRVASDRNHIIGNENEYELPSICKSLKKGFWGEIIADTLYVSFKATTEALKSEDNRSIADEINNVFNDADVVFEWGDTTGMAKTALDVLSWTKKLLSQSTIQNKYAIAKSIDVLSKCFMFIQFIRDNVQELDCVFDYCTRESLEDLFIPQGHFDRKINVSEATNDTQKNECLISFLEHYRRATETTYFLTFSTGLSSGEKNLLRMMTQFRYALGGPSVYEEDTTSELNTHNKLTNWFKSDFEKANIGVVCDTLFLFLDEADLTYHPDWQRQFIALLTKILPMIIRCPYDINQNLSNDDSLEGCKDIQIVLATHSPLLLSDIPIQSCIFLKKSEDNNRIVVEKHPPIQQTFGANIHDLLNNAFFVERTIGEYAYKKIMEVFNDLKELEEKPEDKTQRDKCKPYDQIIDLIGDPIVHNKLLRLYDRCFVPEKNIDDVINDISNYAELSDKLCGSERDRIIDALEKTTKKLRK